MNVPENFHLNFTICIHMHIIVDLWYYIYIGTAKANANQSGKFTRCDVMVPKFICAHQICWCSISMSKVAHAFACANYFLIWFRSLWDWTWREMNTLNLLFVQVVSVTVCVQKRKRYRLGERDFSCISANRQHTICSMPGVLVPMHEFLFHSLFLCIFVSVSSIVIFLLRWYCSFSWPFLVSKVWKSSPYKWIREQCAIFIYVVFVINIKVICANSLAEIHGNSCI